jgi:hypothetical protein
MKDFRLHALQLVYTDLFYSHSILTITCLSVYDTGAEVEANIIAAEVLATTAAQNFGAPFVTRNPMMQSSSVAKSSRVFSMVRISDDDYALVQGLNTQVCNVRVSRMLIGVLRFEAPGCCHRSVPLIPLDR